MNVGTKGHIDWKTPFDHKQASEQHHIPDATKMVQEPVATVTSIFNGTFERHAEIGVICVGDKLYTHPQQPQEQGKLVRKAVADALEEFAKEIKGLCNDYSSHKRSVYIGDVESDIDELLKQHLLVPKEGE